MKENLTRQIVGLEFLVDQRNLKIKELEEENDILKSENKQLRKHQAEINKRFNDIQEGI